MALAIYAALSARLDELERIILGRARRRVSRNEKARLMGVTPRTVARHVAAGLIEKPDIVNGRWYFWIEEPERDTADSPAAARNPQQRARYAQRDTMG